MEQSNYLQDYEQIMKLSREIWEKHGSPEYVMIEYQSPINVKFPENLSLECIKPEMFLPEYPPEHKIADGKDIISFYSDILNDEIRIEMLNGMPTSDEYTCCDICGKCIQESYYYCFHCNKSYCIGCRDSSADNEHNFQSRQKNILCCENCTYIIIPDNLYTVGSPGKEQYYCRKCSNGITGAIPEKYKCSADYSGFGSILDYLPVIVDSEYNFVMICVNKDNPGYSRICLGGGDDHGRFGFHATDYTMNDINKNIVTMMDDPEFASLEGWDRFYNMPIKRMMENKGIETHFG